MDGQSGRAPLGEAIRKTPGWHSAQAKDIDRAKREDTVRPTAVSNDILAGRTFTDAALEIFQRHGKGAWNREHAW